MKRIAGSKEIPPPLWLALRITLGVTLFAWVFALVSHFIGLPKPYSWPYFTSHQTLAAPHGDRFGDFLVFADQMSKLHTYQFFSGKYIYNYPPAAVIFFRLTTWPFGHKAVPYVLGMFVVVLLAGRFIARQFERVGVSKRQALGFVGGSLLLSAPLQLGFLRGNLEFICVCFTAAGAWMVWKQRYASAAVLFGIAGSMKWFPFILFGIFLPMKRYKEFALAWLVMAGMTLLGLLLETPSFTASVHGSIQGFAAFSAMAITGGISDFAGYDHSILELLKILLQNHLVDFAKLEARYLAVAGFLAGMSYLFRIWRLPVLNQLLALMLWMVLLPPFSADYTLSHLYAPLALLMVEVTAGTVRWPRGVLYAAMGCVGVVFGLKSFVIVGGRMYAAQVNTVFLLILLGLVLWFPLEIAGWDEKNTRGKPV